ncbi:MAG: DNA polymerase [Patescibacteria group bacterium]
MKKGSDEPSKKRVSTVPKRLVLLDVHAILHRAYHALPEFASSKGEPTGALYGLCTMIIKIVGELHPDYIAACYDLPGPTYRHEAYKDYKAGRSKTDEALVAQIIRSKDIFTAFNIPVYEMAGFEADDMLGTIVEQVLTRKDLANFDVVIASGDMDTLQLVKGDRVQVYTLKKGIKDTVIYDEAGVKERFSFGPELLPDYKGLRGDPSDNIIGIKGIGEKTATILIQKFGSIESMYKALKKDPDAFEGVVTPRMAELLKQGEEEANFSKMLASIRRDAPVTYTIPEKGWKEGIETQAILDLFSALEFRALGSRVKEAFSLQGSLLDLAPTVGPNGEEKNEGSAAESAQNIDPAQLKETSIALYLVNSNLSNPGLEEILQFAKTRDFAKARTIILDELRKRGGEKVLRDIEMPIVPVVEKMEQLGVKVDKTYLKELSVRYHKELNKLEKSIWEMSGGEEFNINSPKQLGEILFVKMGLVGKNMKKTEGGVPSTRESELEKLRELHPIISKILEYREFQKLLSTYIDNIPGMLDDNSRLHATFLQAGAATGRMSSNSPNLQNIPIKTELGRNIRKAFVAEKGFALLDLDYSQIELRIAAFLSGDEKLKGIFKRGEDVHTAVAAQVFKVPLEKVDKEMRRRAKVINFGILYGMGINALRTNLGTDRKEAQAFHDAYFETFSELAKYIDATKAAAARQGYVETFFGRRRNFEGIKSPIPYIRAAAERMAVNAPMQGTQADLIKLAMGKIDAYLNEKGLADDVRLILQVHDELVYEVRESIAKKVGAEIRTLMEGVITQKETDGVPICANASIGPNWGEVELL